VSAEKLLVKKPTELIRLAVKGMLPKNSLGRQMLRKLKLYSGPNHPHESQAPISLEI
jgi:large subunit ribosomal protein L13